MTTYKISNCNGRFDHVNGKAAAITKINEIQKTTGLNENELVREFGWTIEKITKSQARAVGLA